MNSRIFVHPNNFVKAMAFATPASIEPEWYFLSYYCVLRSLPHKLIGTLRLIMSMVFYATVLLTDDWLLGTSFSAKLLCSNRSSVNVLQFTSQLLESPIPSMSLSQLAVKLKSLGCR